jgi:hypothetical protein
MLMWNFEILKMRRFKNIRKSIGQLQLRLYKPPLGVWGLVIIFALSSCKIYRLSDASVDPNLKTFTVNPTNNIATFQNANAAAAFTEKLKEKFIRETRMVLMRENGDIEYNCTITEYNIEPIALTNTQTLAQNRLNINVRVECTNHQDETKSYTQNFRDGENFDAQTSFANVEAELLNTIYDRITQQIFNKSFSNW